MDRWADAQTHRRTDAQTPHRPDGWTVVCSGRAEPEIDECVCSWMWLALGWRFRWWCVFIPISTLENPCRTSRMTRHAWFCSELRLEKDSFLLRLSFCLIPRSRLANDSSSGAGADADATVIRLLPGSDPIVIGLAMRKKEELARLGLMDALHLAPHTSHFIQLWVKALGRESLHDLRLLRPALRGRSNLLRLRGRPPVKPEHT